MADETITARLPQVERLKAISYGAKVDEVYGKEWCTDPAWTFREDLRVALMMIPGGIEVR